MDANKSNKGKAPEGNTSASMEEKMKKITRPLSNLQRHYWIMPPNTSAMDAVQDSIDIFNTLDLKDNLMPLLVAWVKARLSRTMQEANLDLRERLLDEANPLIAQCNKNGSDNVTVEFMIKTYEAGRIKLEHDKELAAEGLLRKPETRHFHLKVTVKKPEESDKRSENGSAPVEETSTAHVAATLPAPKSSTPAKDSTAHVAATLPVRNKQKPKDTLIANEPENTDGTPSTQKHQGYSDASP